MTKVKIKKVGMNYIIKVTDGSIDVELDGTIVASLHNTEKNIQDQLLENIAKIDLKRRLAGAEPLDIDGSSGFWANQKRASGKPF